MAKEDIKQYKRSLVQKLLKENKSMKIFRKQSNTKKKIIKLMNKEDLTIIVRTKY